MRGNRLQEKKSKTRILWLLLTLALLLPLAFINIKNSHDWGDDFAMYLIEAENIVHHKDAAQSGFIINPDAMIGPQSYPIGFPLLLAPVVRLYDLNFHALNRYQSLLLVVTLFFGFLFLYRHFSGLSSLLMTLVIAYNPVILSFKTEILSDIPFWCILNGLLCLIYYKKNSIGWLLLSGALIGFSIHVRSIGLAVLLSFVIYKLLNDFKDRSFELKSYAAFFLSFVIVYVGLKYLYPINSSYQYLEGEVLNTSANHLSYNLESICNFFKAPALTDFYFVTSVCAYCFLTFMLLGFFIELKSNPVSFVNLLIVIFVGVVILYHFGDAGIRLILPLLFVFFYYFALAFKQALNALQFRYKPIALTFCIFLFCCYWQPLIKIMGTSEEMVEGPCTTESAAVFNYMKTNHIVNSAIGFDRPRALALFTGNKSVHLSDEHLKEEVKKYKLDYVLVHQLETSDAKKNIIYGDTVSFRKIYGNAVYGLFKVGR